MQSLPARGFTERDEAELLEPLPYLLCSFDHNVEGHIRRRIEIEHEATGQSSLMGLVIPRMEFHCGDLRGRDQAFDAVELHIWLAVPFHGNEFDQARYP